MSAIGVNHGFTTVEVTKIVLTMEPLLKLIRCALCVHLALVLTACGGGGGSTPAPAPIPVPPPVVPTTCTGAEAFSVLADASVMVGKAAGAVLAGCSGPISNVQWTQTAGPGVALLAAKTQAISFEPPTAGAYGFTASFVDAGGAIQTTSVSINAAGSTSATPVTLRVDHAAREGGNVSLRAWPALASGETNTWTRSLKVRAKFQATTPTPKANC